MIWPSNTFVSIYQNALASERLPVHLIYYSNGAGVDLNEFSQKDLSSWYAGHMLIPSVYYGNDALVR